MCCLHQCRCLKQPTQPKVRVTQRGETHTPDTPLNILHIAKTYRQDTRLSSSPDSPDVDPKPPRPLHQSRSLKQLTHHIIHCVRQQPTSPRAPPSQSRHHTHEPPHTRLAQHANTPHTPHITTQHTALHILLIATTYNPDSGVSSSTASPDVDPKPPRPLHQLPSTATHI